MTMEVRKVALPMVVALMAFVAVAQASAATATESPSGSKTGTATAIVKLTITSGSARTVVTCAAAGFTGTWNPGAGTFPLATSTNTALTFTNCSIPGPINVRLTCNVTEVLSVTGVTTNGVTPLNITKLTCSLSLGNDPTGCKTTIEGAGPTGTRGSLAGHYSNSTQQLTILATGQDLVSKNSDCSRERLLFDGTGAYSDATSGGDVLYNVTPTTTITVV
jgi:hypothetical protein